MKEYPSLKIGKTLQVHLDRLDYCDEISQFSNCLSRKVGAILIKNNHVASIGYNRVPTNTESCKTCRRCSKHSGESLDICKAIHAEEAAIFEFLKTHTAEELKDCILYVSVEPCYHCAKLIADFQIKQVYAKRRYNSNYTATIFDEASVTLNILSI